MESLRVGLLGLNAWIVLLVVPSLHYGRVDASGTTVLTQIALALSPLAVLAAGLYWLRGGSALGRWALLAFYPPALGLVLAARPVLVEREVFDPITIGLGALSLSAYAVVAARACARPRATMGTTVHPSNSATPVVEPTSRRLVRRALLWLSTIGGLGLVAIVPIWTGRSDRAERWGEGADDGTVLTIVVGTVAAAFAIGAIVGPGLRARRRRTSKRKGRSRRLLVALGLALATSIGWVLLEHFDRSL